MNTRRALGALMIASLALFASACSSDSEGSSKKETTTTAAETTTTAKPLTDEEYTAAVAQMSATVSAAGTDLCKVAATGSPPLPSTPAQVKELVGLYAELVDINAYHQPGVEAGKLAARGVLTLQHRLLRALGEQPRTVTELADALACEPFAVWQLARRLALAGRIRSESLADPASARFAAI